MNRLMLLGLIVPLIALSQARQTSAITASSDPCQSLNWNWRHAEELTWKQSLNRTKGISASERERLVAVIAKQLSDTTPSIEERKIAAEFLHIKDVDLNSDGKREVIVQGGGDSFVCSPTGNCSFWNIRRGHSHFDVLLSADAQTFTIQPTISHGYHDIVLTRHADAFQSEAKEFRFDGNRYQLSLSFSVLWYEQGSDGEQQRLQKPKIDDCRAE